MYPLKIILLLLLTIFNASSLEAIELDNINYQAFNAPSDSIGPLALDGKYLWAFDCRSRFLFKLNIDADLSICKAYRPSLFSSEFIYDMVFIDGELYAAVHHNLIKIKFRKRSYHYDILSQHPEMHHLRGILATGQHRLILHKNMEQVFLLEKKSENWKVDTINSLQLSFPSGISYSNQKMWSIDRYYKSLTVRELHSGKLLGMYKCPGKSPFGIAVDEDLIWISDIIEKKIFCMKKPVKQDLPIKKVSSSIDCVRFPVEFKNQTISPQNKPYLLDSIIHIPKNVSIYIKPGVTIYCTPDSGFTVSGTLKIFGTKEKPVVFQVTDNYFPWKGFVFRKESKNSEINNTWINRAENAIKVEDTGIIIRHSKISNCSNMAVSINIAENLPSPVIISHNWVNNSGTYGIALNFHHEAKLDSDLIVCQNVIENCEAGFSLYSSDWKTTVVQPLKFRFSNNWIKNIVWECAFFSRAKNADIRSNIINPGSFSESNYCFHSFQNALLRHNYSSKSCGSLIELNHPGCDGIIIEENTLRSGERISYKERLSFTAKNNNEIRIPFKITKLRNSLGFAIIKKPFPEINHLRIGDTMEEFNANDVVVLSLPKGIYSIFLSKDKKNWDLYKKIRILAGEISYI